MTDPEPDHFFVGQDPGRLATDGGPRYKETPADPLANAGLAEPFNTVTAFLFVVIVVVWVARLRGRFRRHPFTAASLPILLVGAVGGTLYHATRTRRLYFLLDVIPISLLGAAGAVFLSLWLGRAYGWVRVLLFAVGLLGFYLFVNWVLFRAVRTDNRNLTVNLSYAALALMLLLPLGAVMVRTRFRHAGWIVGGLASFVVAWFCRLVDNTPWGDLPMGTHWLWHTFGALTTQAVYEYFYRLEGDSRGPADG